MSIDAELAALRAEVDAVNRDLVDVLQRRARLVIQIARRKRALGVPLLDPAREREMLDAALRAPGPGFARDELARALAALFACYRDLCVRAGSGT
jgi:chorismate mutase